MKKVVKNATLLFSQLHQKYTKNPKSVTSRQQISVLFQKIKNLSSIFFPSLGKQTTIEHLQTLTKQIAEDINFGSIKTTVDNMVRDIKDLKDTKSVASMRSNNRRKSNLVRLKSVSSSTEDLRSDSTEDLSSTLSCSTSATPSALSRAAENVVNAELNQSEIGPIVKRSRKSLMPRRNSYSGDLKWNK